MQAKLNQGEGARALLRLNAPATCGGFLDSPLVGSGLLDAQRLTDLSIIRMKWFYILKLSGNLNDAEQAFASHSWPSPRLAEVPEATGVLD